MFKKQFIIVP